MSTALAEPQNEQPVTQRRPNPAAEFRHRNTATAMALLREWVGEERASEASGRIAAALSASAAAARDPADFYSCTAQSIATSIAVAALTGIMPAVGATALAYVVPQRPRKNEAPQLQYMLSHRGLNALARRCGQTMIAVPVGMNDRIQSNSDGDVEIVTLDIDHPPVKFDELRGVMVIVKELGTNAVTFRGWMPRVLIEQRRKMSRSAESSFSPWHNWPVEMSMKTAMHYAISRGWCVIDDTSATKALSVEAAADLRELPAPSGPTDVGELASLIGGEASQQDDQSPESTAVLQSVTLDLSFLADESAANWSTRVLKSIQAATSSDQLLEIQAELDRLINAGDVTSKRCEPLVQAINEQDQRLSR